jgi:hypothetical protein
MRLDGIVQRALLDIGRGLRSCNAEARQSCLQLGLWLARECHMATLQIACCLRSRRTCHRVPHIFLWLLLSCSRSVRPRRCRHHGRVSRNLYLGVADRRRLLACVSRLLAPAPTNHSHATPIATHPIVDDLSGHLRLHPVAPFTTHRHDRELSHSPSLLCCVLTT